MAVQITGITNLLLLSVRYIAIDKDFPHHLNTFENVPVNYTAGPLINISSASLSSTIYSNTINYTTQATASGCTYTTFSTPLSNNKIVLFLTSLFTNTVPINCIVENYI